MNFKCIFLSLLIILNSSYAQGPEENQIDTKIEVEAEESSLGFFDRWQFFLGVNGGTQNNDLYKDQPDIGEVNLRVFTGIGFNLGKGFSVSALYFIKSSTDQKTETNRDEDIQDSNGKEIRLVERDIEYEVTSKDHFRYLVQYDIPIKGNHIFQIFTGYSTYNESHFSERYDMTDREKPTIFSNHNRYYLTQDTIIKNKNYHAGLNWVYQKGLIIGLGYTMSKRSLVSNYRNIDTRGESIAFNESDFYFTKRPESLIKDQHSLELNISLRW